MAEESNGRNDERVKVAFMVELAVERPAESTDFDPVSYCGEMLLDAISGWGIGVTRVAHVTDPDSVFAT
jgi:hypothetical protein